MELEEQMRIEQRPSGRLISCTKAYERLICGKNDLRFLRDKCSFGTLVCGNIEATHLSDLTLVF